MISKIFPTAAQSREQKEFDRLKREADSESRKAAKICINTLERLRFDHFLRKEVSPGMAAAVFQGKRKHQTVKFSYRRADETTIWLKVDVENLPWGVKSVDFLEDYIEKELGLAVALPVKIHWSIRRGVWIIITRDGSLAGIPKLVPFVEAQRELPKNAPPLEFMLGMMEGKQWLRYNLGNAPHLLVAGTTRSGKSKFLNQMVLTMVRRNAPEQLKLWMIDLKGGVELTMFEDLPHVDKFVTEAGDADGLTTEVLKEINRREKEVKGHAKNIDGWNQLQSRHKDKQWPRILLIIDEYAQLKGQKANRALENLTMIFAKGGAFGIHCIVATQVPNRDVIDSLVKNNITVRAAFNSASYAHSMNMLDNGDAFGLGNRGRFVFSLHGDKTLVQAPLIEDKDEQSLVAEVKAYWSEAQDIVGDFDYKNLLRYAIDNMNYQIPMRKVAQAFSGQVSRFGVETYLAKIEGQTVNVDGKDYMVIAGNNRTPRRLMPLFSLPQELASSGQPPTELIEMGDA